MGISRDRESRTNAWTRSRTYRAARLLTLLGSLVLAASVALPWFSYPGDFGPACSVPGLQFIVGKLLLLLCIAVALSCVGSQRHRALCVGWILAGLLACVVAVLPGPGLLDQQSITDACGSAFRFGFEYGAQGNVVLLFGSLLVIAGGVTGAVRRQ